MITKVIFTAMWAIIGICIKIWRRINVGETIPDDTFHSICPAFVDNVPQSVRFIRRKVEFEQLCVAAELTPVARDTEFPIRFACLFHCPMYTVLCVLCSVYEQASAFSATLFWRFAYDMHVAV